jgi:actin-related protein 9
LLEGQGFDHEMAEQLKKSSVCEVLPLAPDQPGLVELPVETGAGAAAGSGSAAAPAAAEGGAPKVVEPPRSFPPGANDDEAGAGGDTKEIEDDGVLDVANIVASGQTREFLAKKEKEKAEKAAKVGRKGKEKEGGDASAAKTARLPNAKRVKNTFHYEELVTEDVPVAAPPKVNGVKDVAMADAAPAADGAAAAAAGDDAPPKVEPADQQQPPRQPPSDAQPTTEAAAPHTATERVTRRVRRDIEVGLERFQFADRRVIDRIATAIYRTVQDIEDMYMRPGCWENIVFVGNGARVRGLRDNVMQTLQARHLVSPSSATMFTSELPSNMGTPSGTGSQTPTSSYAGVPGGGGGVNPLLQAATTASLTGVPGSVANAAAAGSTAGGGGGGSGADGTLTSHHFHSQTPTTIRLAPLPAYLSEWTKHGFEEAMFLGAQVAARIAFCIHNLDAQGLEAQRLMSLSRVDYK